MSEQNGDTDLTINDAVSEGIRLGLASSLGENGFNTGDEETSRNYFEVFGWPRDDLDGWDEDNWLALYVRNAYAKVVNDKPAFTTWRGEPEIIDRDGEEPSAFERAVEKADRGHNVWSYCERTDRAAGIGQHGLLLVGFEDTANDTDAWSDDPAEKDFNGLDSINSFKPILETQIEDIEWGTADSERWGKPVEYRIDLSEDIDEETEDDPVSALNVHHRRVVDVPATRPLDDEVLARPRVEPVLNNLLDIEKTLGAAAEAAYRAADYGLHLNADPTQVDFSDGASELETELQRYEHDLQRYIRTQGVDVERLGGDIQDPSGIIERNLDAIAAQTGIPKRELRGNQQGEQAGAEQDTKSYFGMIQERRRQYATPHIVRQLIDILNESGVLPDPQGGDYEVRWPDLATLSEQEQSTIDSNRAAVIAQVPGLAGDTAIQYLKNGPDALPEFDTDMEVNELDESNPGVRDEFLKLTENQGEVGGLDLTPPEGAQEAAQRALDFAEEHGRDIAMSSTGWNRAEQLAAGEELSPADIADGTDGMGNWWARHASHTLEGGDIGGELALDDDKEAHQDPSYVAGLGWGGAVGARWADRMKAKIEDARNE